MPQPRITLHIRPKEGGIEYDSLLGQVIIVARIGLKIRPVLFKPGINADNDAVHGNMVLQGLRPGIARAVMLKPRNMQALSRAGFTRMGMYQRRNELQQRQENDQEFTES